MTHYRMPAEWHPHERCWMAWPARDGMWADPAATCRAYTAVAHTIADYEPVGMLVNPRHLEQARDYLGSDIDLVEMPIDDSWARDSGPNFVLGDNGDLAGVCFGFNAWGEKYHPYDQDAALAGRLLDHLGKPVIRSKLIAEGGGICVDGEGTLITTDTCFTHVNRNPDWSRDDVESELKRLLGVEKVIWLPGDPLDGETDGHVDGVAAFSKPGSIIIESTDNPDDPRKPFFDSLREALAGQTDAKGRTIELLELPEACEEAARSDNFCLSYVNFYIANGAIIAPSYGISTDEEVRDKITDYFPGRKVRLVPVSDIAVGGGGIHCITQQQPTSA